MSKYARITDIEKLLYRKGFCIGKTPDELYEALSDLPTIEVSEDCISREWVLEKIDDCYGETEYACNLAVALEREVKSAPSIVPTVRKTRWVERAEGEWITDTFGKEEIYVYPVICSECGKESILEWGKHTPYCPNCGSRNRKENEE